ncbi:hypothetical protein [Paraliomyxa miuraensis]|uniref:hypothetical protein n=1 Tax=Paraliomyxa miuraensis TaxID=376150 RepID=UPI00225BACFD|nr:hypothetical protein [Paraliomyxa miuraensis]MCX4246548.1 hypothetical protein [Paraliomyxa miuraensis]
MSTNASHEGEPRVPDLMLEKLALGELPEARASALRQRLEAEGDERLAAIERSNAEILREHPPDEVAAAVHRRLARLDHDRDAEQRGRPRAGWMMWAPVAAAAGVLLVWTLGRDGDGGGGVDEGGAIEGEPTLIAKADPEHPAADGGTAPEQIFLKGDPVLSIDRVHEGRPERMSEGARVAQGELLQVTYNAKGAQQGVIVSIDGAGVATLHFPASEGDDPRLAHGGPIPLSESYELDDAPGFERFFFVTVDGGEVRLSVARVMEAARALATSEQARDGELELPQDWRQQSIRLDKDE